VTLLCASPRLPQRFGRVPVCFAFADRPRLADEPTVQLPLANLVAQRGSRHPETGSGFGKGQHLAGELRPRLMDDGLAVGVTAPAATSDIAGRAAHVEPSGVGLCFELVDEDFELRHPVLLGGAVHGPNLHPIVYVVKPYFQALS